MTTAQPRNRAAVVPEDRGSDSAAPARWGRASVIGVVVAAAVGVAAWLPFLHTPLTSDESGFLLLSQQWTGGDSLYGNYWVDRPPLLLWLFWLAGHLGPTSYSAAGLSAPGVKLLGAAAVGTAVLLSGVLSRLTAPTSGWPRHAATVLAVALLSSPLLGMPETDGEVLAVPFVLLGVTCLVGAVRRPPGRRALLYAAGAGASAMSAFLIKQNVLDVFVFALVLFVLTRHRVWHPDRRVGAVVGAFVGGSVATLAAAVTAAALQGTSPASLWDAVVVFRLHASEVIGSSASEATPERLTNLALAFLASGAALVLTAAAVALRQTHNRRPATRTSTTAPTASGPHDLTWPAVAMVAWEVGAMALGGSYWLHYLTGLVPGLVLLLSLVRPTGRASKLLAGSLAYAVFASAAVWLHQAVAPVTVSTDAQVTTYLRAHASRGDGVVVAFGHPDIVAGSDLNSPYEHLWSLPVRVRDPQLEELRRVLAGASAPRWVVVDGDSLASWGLDAQAAQHYLEQHYVDQVAYGDWHVWQRQGG